MTLRRTIPPIEYAVTVEEAKAFCRVRHASEDTLFETLIAAASEHIEATLDLTIVAQTWEYTVDGSPLWIELPRRPVTEVLLIQYVDSDYIVQTLPSDQYLLDLAPRAPKLVPALGVSWPWSRTFVVLYEAETPEAERERLRMAILFLVNHWYENRLPTVMDPAAMAIIEPFRRLTV